MYAIVNYKGNQILVREGENTRIPFLKDSKIGSTLNFDNVLFFDDGKKSFKCDNCDASFARKPV